MLAKVVASNSRRLNESDLLSLVKIIGFGRFSVGIFDQILRKVKLNLLK